MSPRPDAPISLALRHVGVHRALIVYLAGADGTGKTTQAETLVAALNDAGVPASYVWLRFPQYVSLPVLALSRLLGVTRYRFAGRRRMGRWEFDRMPWLAWALLWCQVVDVRIARRRRIDPLVRRGQMVVLDRFVYDIAIDIASSARDDSLLNGKAARLLYRTAADATTFILDAPVGELVARRAELGLDDRLSDRVRMFRAIAGGQKVNILDTTVGVEVIHRQILMDATRNVTPLAKASS